MSTGEKEITIYDLARKLNISATTVSRALQNNPRVNKKTSKLVHDLALSTGYRSNYVARNLRHQRTQTIGVIVPRISDSFMSSVIASMEDVASKAGFNLIISQSFESAEREISQAAIMFDRRVDGLLVSCACETNDIQHYDSFLKKTIPVLFFDQTLNDHQFTKIVIDNRRAAELATQHLIAQGCKRIVHVTGQSCNRIYTERLQGYIDALNRANLLFEKKLVIYNQLDYEAGVEVANYILQMKDSPDGVFVANDNCAVSCMITLKKAGIRIPQDIAFVGFNNDAVSKAVEPNLTTVDYPGGKMGEAAMRHMVNTLSSDSVSSMLDTLTIRSDLIIRESSLRK